MNKTKYLKQNKAWVTWSNVLILWCILDINIVQAIFFFYIEKSSSCSLKHVPQKKDTGLQWHVSRYMYIFLGELFKG